MPGAALGMSRGGSLGEGGELWPREAPPKGASNAGPGSALGDDSMVAPLSLGVTLVSGDTVVDEQPGPEQPGTTVAAGAGETKTGRIDERRWLQPTVDSTTRAGTTSIIIRRERTAIGADNCGTIILLRAWVQGSINDWSGRTPSIASGVPNVHGSLENGVPQKPGFRLKSTRRLVERRKSETIFRNFPQAGARFRRRRFVESATK